MFAPVDIGLSLDRALAAFDSPRLIATIESHSKSGKVVEVSSSTVQRGSDGSWTVRMQSPPTAKTDRVDIMYRVRQDRVDGWNRLWKERLTLPVPKAQSNSPALTRLSLATPPTLEAELLTSPSARKGTFEMLRKVKGWKQSGNVWKAQGNGVNLTVRFDGSGRWVGYTSAGKGQEVSFKISYPTSALAFAPPSSAAQVRAFATPPPLPKGADESLLRDVLAAHKHFRGTVSSQKISSTIGTRRLSERRPDRTWQWSKDILTVTTKGKTRSVKAKISDIIEKLGIISGDGPDAYVRELILGRIPFANVLSPTARLKRIGEASSDGVACDILEVKAENRRITLFVRKSDRLVASATVEGVDARGRTLTRNLRTYQYKKG
ncbi:hypothetical protein EON81_06355 [bacterium]|nr:MAG: hypothetical protein EON81_06355 [bacterium]